MGQGVWKIMIIIKELSIPDEKAKICNTILRALPDWFGIESSIIDYVEQVQSMPFFAAVDDEAVFVLLR